MPNRAEPGACDDRGADLKSQSNRFGGGGSEAESASVRGRAASADRAAAVEAPLSDLGDAWLVERAKRGDHQAFAVLVRRYERKLIRVLVRLVRDPETARDLGQETLFRVYSRLDQFDTGRRFGPWLFRAGVNLGLDWLRSRKNESAAAALSLDRSGRDGRPAFEPSDADPRVQADLAQEVQFILERIPVAYRTILVLRDLEGFSSSEVAAIVGRREATVRWRLSKARERFRELWRLRHEGERETAAADEGGRS